MALAYRTGSAVSAGNASGGDLVINKPTGTVDGDRVTVEVYFEPDTCTISLTGGPWETVEKANTGAFKIKTFTKIASGEPASYTASNDVAGNQWRAAVAVAYSGGTGTGTQIDVSSTAQADAVANTSQTAPSVTPTGTNRMIVYGYGNFSGTNVSTMSGFCSNMRVSLGGCTIADAIQATATATGTSNPNAGPGTDDYAAMHVALISDIGGAAATSLPLPPPRMPLAILAR